MREDWSGYHLRQHLQPQAITASDPPQSGPSIAQKPTKFGWQHHPAERIEALVARELGWHMSGVFARLSLAAPAWLLPSIHPRSD